MTVEDFNKLDTDSARSELAKCCNAAAWVECMLNLRPFQQVSSIFLYADVFWSKTNTHDWLEAIESQNEVVKSIQSEDENPVKHQIELQLDTYEKKFGFPFVLSPEDCKPEIILEKLNERMPNERDNELKIASEEQRRIMRHCLDHLFN